MTLEEAATLLGVAVADVQAFICRGDLRAIVIPESQATRVCIPSALELLGATPKAIENVLADALVRETGPPRKRKPVRKKTAEDRKANKAAKIVTAERSRRLALTRSAREDIGNWNRVTPSRAGFVGRFSSCRVEARRKGEEESLAPVPPLDEDPTIKDIRGVEENRVSVHLIDGVRFELVKLRIDTRRWVQLLRFPHFVGLPEAAKRLGLCPEHFRQRYVLTGRVEAVQFQKRCPWYIYPDSLEKLIERREKDGCSPPRKRSRRKP